MTDSTLFTLGTPFGQWPTVAPSFLGHASALDPAVARWHQEVVGAPLLDVNGSDLLASLDRIDVSPAMVARLHALRPSAALWGGADARMCWTAHALAEGFPAARFLVWVDSPARSLAHWLSASGESDPAHMLGVFESAAQSIIRLVHRHLPRCLVVHTDEALAHPAALARLLADWIGLDAASVVVPEMPRPDALRTVLAERLAASHAGVLRAYERLYASCVPLVQGHDAQPAPAEDATAAVAQYRQLAQRATSGAALAPQLQAAQEECQRARDALDQAERGSDLMLVQLHQTQEELEATFLKQQEASAQLTHARQEHEAARSEQQQALQQAKAELEKAQAAHRAATLDRDSAVKARDSLRAQADRQTQENELMLVQLHQVQEELEHYYLAYRDLEAGAATVRAGAAPVKVDRVEAGAERDTPPHRELALVLAGAQAPDRRLDRVDARLVDHHGRPGLAFFAAGEGPQPLMAWQPTGTEADRAYMLFVPTDEASALRLQRLGTADWQFTQAVASHIARSLQEAGTAPARWRVVSRRLLQQLADLPPRFRFDSVDVAADAGAAGALVVTFGNVSFGDRRAASLRLRWRSGAADDGTPSIELLAPEAGDEEPILGAWPVDDAGAWRAAWCVPLGGAPRQALEAEWKAMPRDDRELLLGVLDALPAAARRAAEAGVVESGRAAALLLAAARPLRTAYRLLHGTRLRRVARALRGRLS